MPTRQLKNMVNKLVPPNLLSYYVNRLIQVTASSIVALVTPVIANCITESMSTRQPNNMVPPNPWLNKEKYVFKAQTREYSTYYMNHCISIMWQRHFLDGINSGSMHTLQMLNVLFQLKNLHRTPRYFSYDEVVTFDALIKLKSKWDTPLFAACKHEQLTVYEARNKKKFKRTPFFVSLGVFLCVRTILFWNFFVHTSRVGLIQI